MSKDGIYIELVSSATYIFQVMKIFEYVLFGMETLFVRARLRNRRSRMGW